MNAVLLWALPSDWTQFELLAPDVGEQIESEVRRRFEGTGVDEDDVARLIDTQIQSLLEFAQDGVVLLATRPEQPGGKNDPPPGLSLTLALANLPSSGPGGESDPSPDSASSEAGSTSPTGGPAPTRSAPMPLVLQDPDMTAFTIEEHTEVVVAGPGGALKRFQAQVFVMPKDQAGMAVVTVTTFDPDREGDARKSARDFADTLCFVNVDEASDEPGSG
jgi:hypothetical protein